MSTSRTPRLLLTNDDGIDAPGLSALYEELTAVGDVTVVAPAENQSGVGRTRNSAAVLREHPWGYALAGTPADCVAYGLRGLGDEFDLVVSGVNHGPNAGNYVVGRSGTVGAGIEAAFLGTAAIAISAYHAVDFFTHPPEEYDFSRPARVARAIAERSLGSGVFDDVDLLNVNAPIDVANPRFQLTEPYAEYDQHVEHDPDPTDEPAFGQTVDGDLGDGERVVRLQDRTWPGTIGFSNPFPPDDEWRTRYPVGSDRHALVTGAVSVSPLEVTHGVAEHPELADVIESIEVE